MSNGNFSPADCTGRLCGYTVHKGSVGCSSGNGSCRVSAMLEAKVSDFHTEAIQRATREIKAILERVHKEDERVRRGRKLSFLFTNLGCLLAWVDHGEVITPEDDEIVTSEDDDETIAKALGIEDWDSKQTAQQTF